MKEGWEYKKLGDLCQVLDSQRKPVTKKDRTKGIYPYYGATGIQDYVDSYIFDGRFLLVGEDGAKWGASDKTAYIIEGKSWVNNHAHILKVLENVNERLLEYYLTFKDLSEYITGAVVPKLTQKALVSIPIPIPPLSEQQHIVEELDLLSSIIEKKKTQLRELDNLAQSLFYEMFGDPITNERKWNTLPLGQLSNMVRGPFGSALKKEFFVPQSKDTYKVYEQKHAIQKDDKIGDYYISKEKFEELRRFEVFSGDIIMSCSGTIGEFFEIPQGACRGVMNQALLKFKLNEALINKDYFLFVMQYVKKNFTVHGSGLQNIGSVKVIKSVRIGIPSLDLQSCFSQRLRAINETKILIKKSIEEVETLFNSRMDYYFN